jgi:hypothetical protein
LHDQRFAQIEVPREPDTSEPERIVAFWHGDLLFSGFFALHRRSEGAWLPIFDEVPQRQLLSSGDALWAFDRRTGSQLRLRRSLDGGLTWTPCDGGLDGFLIHDTLEEAPELPASVVRLGPSGVWARTTEPCG